MKRGKPLRRTSAKRKSVAVPKAVYEAVLFRDRGCRGAGAIPVPCQGRIDPHHILRRSQGGLDTLDNLVALCRVHHSWVHDHPKESYELGFLKHSWEQ